MRVLLDEHLPHRLRRLFAPDVEAITVAYLGWKGRRNGDLLRATQDEGFDVLVTMDQGLPHQQDLRDIRIGILLLEAKSNRLADLEPLMASVHDALKRIQPGEILRVTSPATDTEIP